MLFSINCITVGYYIKIEVLYELSKTNQIKLVNYLLKILKYFYLNTLLFTVKRVKILKLCNIFYTNK